MAGANMLLASGYQAIEWNPANLALLGAPRWSFGYSTFEANASVAGTTVTDLMDIMSAGGEGESSLLDRIPSTGLLFDLNGDGFAISQAAGVADWPDPGGDVVIPSFAITFGRFGFSVRNQVQSTATLSKDLTDLTVNGFNPERITEYSVGNTRFSSVSLTSFTAAMGWRIEDFSFGASVRGVLGNRLIQGRLFEPEIDLDQETLSVSAIGIESPSAKGIGIDLGVVYQPNSTVSLGVSVQNLVQRLTWDDALLIYSDNISDQDFEDSDVREIVDRFRGEDLDPEGAPLLAYDAAEGLFDEAFFPRIIRVGGALSARWGGSIQAVYSATQGAGRFYGPWDDRISVGVEQRLPVISLRGGFASASSGMQVITGGLGLSMGPLVLDLMAGKISGTSDEHGDFDGLMASLGLSLVGR